MASWQDGAEYAPTKRPDGFAAPVVEPLTVAPDWDPGTPGPVAYPAQFTNVEATPLSQVNIGAAASRDPSAPFAVQSSVTAEAAMQPLPPPTNMLPVQPGRPSHVDRWVVRPATPAAQKPTSGKQVLPQQKPLLLLMLGGCLLGVLVPPAASVFLILTGLLGVLRVPSAVIPSTVALGGGCILSVLQYLPPTLDVGYLAWVGNVALGVMLAPLLIGDSDDAPRPPQ